MLLFLFCCFFFVVRFPFSFLTQRMRPICACSCIQNAPPVIITGVTAVAAYTRSPFCASAFCEFHAEHTYRRRRRHHTCDGTAREKKQHANREIKTEKRWTPNTLHSCWCWCRCFFVYFSLLLLLVFYMKITILRCAVSRHWSDRSFCLSIPCFWLLS